MDDTELTEALARDLDAAFETLVRGHVDRCFAIALRVLGNPHDAEEVAQDALVRAYRAMADYPGEPDPRAAAATVARHDRRQPVPQPDPPPRAADHAAGAAGRGRRRAAGRRGRGARERRRPGRGPRAPRVAARLPPRPLPHPDRPPSRRRPLLRRALRGARPSRRHAQGPGLARARDAPSRGCRHRARGADRMNRPYLRSLADDTPGGLRTLRVAAPPAWPTTSSSRSAWPTGWRPSTRRSGRSGSPGTGAGCPRSSRRPTAATPWRATRPAPAGRRRSPRPCPAALADAISRRLAGERRVRIPLDLRGRTEFEVAVWTKALEIPRGEVRPYGWIAAEIGRPRAVRAVGTALGHNPVPLIVPCHRVVRTDGTIGQYSLGGPGNKRTILSAEGLDPAAMETPPGAASGCPARRRRGSSAGPPAGTRDASRTATGSRSGPSARRASGATVRARSAAPWRRRRPPEGAAGTCRNRLATWPSGLAQQGSHPLDSAHPRSGSRPRRCERPPARSPSGRD